MGFARTLRAACGVSLAGTLIFATATTAAADQAREAQWPLKKLDAEAIWKISKGKGVTVGLIDGGVKANHIDLEGSVIEGKDFVDGGSTDPAPGDNHGTSMASIIAGHGHGSADSSGVMGLAPEAKILDIRDFGNGTDGFANSIRYAVDHGASVINISQGGDLAQKQAAEDAAVAYALKHDALVIAATGNSGSNYIGRPASDPGVVGVGAVQEDGEIWSDSNYGSGVLLTAPGANIVSASAKTDFSYQSADGTSDAAAYVSAAAALLRSKFPDLTAGQIANRLVKTAVLPNSAKGASLPDEHYGYGYIQPLAALTSDIPAGSKYGPLNVPESLKQSSNSATTTADGTSSSSSNTQKRMLVFGGLGLIALVVITLVIFVIVKIARRNKGGGNGPGGGTPAGYVPGQPPYGQQPHGNAYPTPQPGQPSYPNQPQQRPQSPWGNQ